MYIRGLIPRNSTELAEAVPIGGGPDIIYIFSHQRISKRAVRTSPEKQLNPRGPFTSRGVSVTVSLRKLITTSKYPGGSGPLPPSVSAHV